MDIAVNIDDGHTHVRKAVQTPKPTPLRVGDADRPKTLQGNAFSSYQSCCGVYYTHVQILILSYNVHIAGEVSSSIFSSELRKL